ncbi:MAG: glycerol-3-phosphate 1-O-acyltransferase [Phycisphaerales bacterium]|nr:MAG: glycerol-3-phosphate 1-O-acyltransferase [Phycisphaerales bacterium]
MMPHAAQWAIGFAFAFLCGSIPFGLLIARARGVDIRAHGSGNVGATNVLRVLGPRAGALCFALDVLKGALPIALIGVWTGAMSDRALGPGDAALWLFAAACAPIGHMYSPWIGFKGGKGVATGFGAMLGLYPHLTLPALLAFALFLASLRVTRYVGVSSCVAAASIPLWFTILRLLWPGDAGESPGERLAAGWPFIAATAALAALVVWRHRSNIGRTLNGTEMRIGERIRVEPQQRPITGDDDGAVPPSR